LRAEASAQALFSKVLSIKPNSALVYYDMAFAATRAGNTGSAIEYLEKTLQVDPFLVTPYKELARLYTIKPAISPCTRNLRTLPEGFPGKHRSQERRAPQAGC
jgi:tetratricopeptide (TPR) repeat protein